MSMGEYNIWPRRNYQSELKYLQLVYNHTEQELAQSRAANKRLNEALGKIDTILQEIWDIHREENDE